MAPHCLTNSRNSNGNLNMEPSEKKCPMKKSPEGVLPAKLCGVCGDKALGYNFNAITCESCKAFFRRNALVSKEFRCPFTEQCEITVITRRFCQKCRLEKCFSIGMVKDYIMSDEDKAQKRQKIAENRAKKRLNPKLRDDEVSSSKLIKREDTEDSNESWTQNSKQLSPICYDDQHNLDSVSSLSQNGQFEIGTNGNNNQAVSVIKNNNLSDSHLDAVIYETNHFDNANKKHDGYLIQYESNCETVPLSVPSNPGLPFHNQILNSNSYNSEGEVNFQNHHDDNFNNLRKDSLEKDEQNVMLRSMLTTSTPSGSGSGDASKLLAPLSNNEQISQPSCDNMAASSHSAKQDKADVARDVLQDVERIPIEPNSIESILCEAIKLEFEAYTSLSQINSSSRELNDAERAKLNELIVANKALLAPLDDHITNLISDDCRFKPSQGQNDPMLLGIINLTAVAIRRLIKMSKKINAFKNMCEEDQVALLKGGCTEMMILRSTMTYDCDRDTWKIPHSQEALGNIKAEVLKLAKGNIYEEHDRFIRTFDPRWRMDENIILIMSAIVLFTPSRQRVVHSDVIKLEQNSYYYLLRRYLESIYPGCEAKSTFLKLIQKIMELHKLTEEVIGVYLDVNPSHVEPLLIEIFDLKQQH